MSSAAQDLILKLLTLDPAKRLKVDEIKKHRFFESKVNSINNYKLTHIFTIDINWETLRRQPAKIIPEYKSTLDTTAFEREGKQFEKDEKLNPFGDQNPNDDDDADDSDGEDGPAVTRMDSTKFRNFNLVRLDLLHEQNLQDAQLMEQKKDKEEQTTKKKPNFEFFEPEYVD